MTLGSLVVPAAALADGQLDPAFNGTGYHLGSAAEGTVFANVDTRIPMVVQADGKIVIGGSRGGAMTLARYNTNGTLDTTFGVGGFATEQFAGTATSAPGPSGATAMTQIGTDIIAAGFGGAQSMVVARFSVNGALGPATVCYAPHAIDYTARAVAVKPNGSIALVGYARDRHAAEAVPGSPTVMYGQRAVVTLPASGVSTAGCGGTVALQGSTGVTIDGLAHDGTVLDPTLAGRYYDGVAALPDNRYVVASTNGPDATLGNAAWVQRYTATGGANGEGTLDATFNAGGRVAIANANLHAIQLSGTDAYAVGESLNAVAASRNMLVARINDAGALVGTFGTGGIALARVAGGNNSGQAFAFQGTNIIVGGGANLAGKSALGLVRLTAAGTVDPSFGNGGQTATPLGVPAVNGYITGLAVTGNFVVVSGRATDPAGLATVAARYFHTGAPPPPPPLPAASTNTVDQITTTSARVNGTVNANGSASTWWVQYGTTTAYGSQTTAQPVAASNDDIVVSAALAGLAPGTVYHARLFISSPAGTDPGEDIAFTTLGTATAGGATGGITGAATTGGTKVTTTVKKKAKAKKQCIVPKVTGKKLNRARSTVFAKGCKVQVRYVKSKKAKNTVLSQSRKAGKKLSFRAVVKLTVATKAVALKNS